MPTTWRIPNSTYLVLKTGGGSKRAGLGRGIHWHIVNQIEYLPTDPEQQNIPYVRVVEDDGSVTEYVDVESGLKPEQVDQSKLVEMDCITCHNRITHLVPTPEDTIDQLIGQGLLAKDIPEIRRQAIYAYSQIYDTTEKGLETIANLELFYQTNYPEYYADNRDKIQAAIKELQDDYRIYVYPEQNSNWTTHPNNAGHKDSPGCFRCHDGKHLNSQQEAIRLECNLCHSVPVVAGPNDFVADLEISRGPEPESHRNPNWISMHHQAFNPTCESCHNTANPGGTDNSSFCSNSACHGSVWKYAGFDAPALREVIQSQLPPTPTPVPQPTPEPGKGPTFTDNIAPLFQSRCGSCHKPNGIQGLDLTTYSGAMKGSSNGPVIVLGDPEGSLLIQKQSDEPAHFGQLSAEELKLVTEWIKAGAPEK
jgi:hypothetical protein